MGIWIIIQGSWGVLGRVESLGFRQGGFQVLRSGVDCVSFGIQGLGIADLSLSSEVFGPKNLSARHW